MDAELNSRGDLIFEYQLQVIAPDTDLTNHHTEVTLEIELISAIDLDVTFIWDRIEEPETESDGNTPKRDDLRLSVGLAIEFAYRSLKRNFQLSAQSTDVRFSPK